eukprot:scaffold101768_cov63-Phaeocystis_antarctica.AAC.1
MHNIICIYTHTSHHTRTPEYLKRNWLLLSSLHQCIASGRRIALDKLSPPEPPDRLEHVYDGAQLQPLVRIEASPSRPLPIPAAVIGERSGVYPAHARMQHHDVVGLSPIVQPQMHRRPVRVLERAPVIMHMNGTRRAVRVGLRTGQGHVEQCRVVELRCNDRIHLGAVNDDSATGDEAALTHLVQVALLGGYAR